MELPDHMTKAKAIGLLLVLAAVCWAIWGASRSSAPPEPRVAAAAEKVLALARGTAIDPAHLKHAADGRRRRNEAMATSGPALANSVALSGFFSPHLAAGFTDEQRVRLEIALAEARRLTLGLMISRGQLTRFPDGRVRVDIPGNAHELAPLRKAAIVAIEEIIGVEGATSLLHAGELGTRFDTQFGHFGRLDTIFEFEIEQTGTPEQPHTYVTIRKSYKGVRSGFILPFNTTSTDVLRSGDFEQRWGSLSLLGL